MSGATDFACQFRTRPPGGTLPASPHGISMPVTTDTMSLNPMSASGCNARLTS